jgi:hypothetical protein
MSEAAKFRFDLRTLEIVDFRPQRRHGQEH